MLVNHRPERKSSQHKLKVQSQHNWLTAFLQCLPQSQTGSEVRLKGGQEGPKRHVICLWESKLWPSECQPQIASQQLHSAYFIAPTKHYSVSWWTLGHWIEGRKRVHSGHSPISTWLCPKTSVVSYMLPTRIYNHLEIALHILVHLEYPSIHRQIQ